MNKKLEKYEKKFDKLIRTFKVIGIAVFLLAVLISIVQYTMNKSKTTEENQESSGENTDYYIDLNDKDIIYEKNFDINFNINNYDENSKYELTIQLNDENVIEREKIEKENKFSLSVVDEGSQNVKIIAFKNDEEQMNITRTIYYIEPYTRQFLDETENHGVVMHIRDGTREKYLTSIGLFTKMGGKYVREDFLLLDKFLEDNESYYATYDKWINEIHNQNLNLILTFNGTDASFSGEDQKINTDEEIDKFVKIAIKIAQRYPFITEYELINEPNAGTKTNKAYCSDEDIYYYTKLLRRLTEELKKINPDISITTGGTTTLYDLTKNTISSEDFIEKINEYSDGKVYDFGYHPYDNENKTIQNGTLYNKLKSHLDLLNSIGGFCKSYITEYGVSSSESYSITEEMQAYKLVQQTTILDNKGIDLMIQYNFWNTTDDTYYSIRNYGLVRNDYTPKLSYYSMKNYYQNTNGSEYIGTLDIEDGLEAHVYDKDGKPLIIAWSDNTDNTYDFTLGEMTAKDIYGKDITPDESGNIQITTSPVYLYNVGNHYFYQAISNTVTQKYDEFTSNFSGEIAKVSGLQASIDNLKQKIQDISSNSTLDETTAINLMEQHYNLGNTIIQAYKSGNLQVEYVKLSSMLDMLDDIGDSFEDLVTVSAKTRNVDLTDTLNSITNAGNLINDSDIEMVYPTKILEFSQDFYDKANYINGLEEENDIKTGLIVSKNLHSKLLANWAIEFANLYVDEYIANNPVEIEYSTIDYTNQDVTATLKTNANITVTNNSNSKTYTFNQNGSFTFEYTIKGRAFTKTATVSNIDKAAPTVTGVENDKLYLDSITPQIQDENLQEVKLYKDNNEVQNYQTNTTISEDGNYKIVAIDKASNQIETTFYISRNPATIGYSTTDLTNQDVIATVNSNFDVEVLNNSNQNTYRFNQNGEFTFEIKIKGTSLNLTATVNNIDKTLPVITGVEENKQYIDKATPMVTDENLNEVKLYLNSYLEEGYVPGTELTEEGFYRLVANDKAGNEITVEFRIMENISEEYIRQGSYIINIKNNTTTSAFDQKIDMGLDYKILRDGNPLTENDIIATGDILRTSAGEELTLIVSGDINKDGDVNIKDIVKLRKYLLVRNNLDELELIAADCNIDGRSISIKDLIRMRLIVLERGVT